MPAIIDRLKSLSAAEEFFAELKVPFDQRVLDVHRLHLLKRFNQLLAAENLDGADTEARCRACLERAYGEFAAAGTAAPKTLKLFQQASQYVPLDSLIKKG